MLFRSLIGANINRRTVENARGAGWQIENVEDLGMGDMFKLITARAEQPQPWNSRVENCGDRRLLSARRRNRPFGAVVILTTLVQFAHYGSITALRKVRPL